MSTLPCLSILQPWAWLIVNGHKDIENRSWSTKFRGRILIHASKAYARKPHDQFAEDLLAEFDIKLPAYDELQRGGIVGSATITDCVRVHSSRWKMDDCWGFVLKDQQVSPFVPLRGQLGIYRVPESAIAQSIEEQQQ